MTENVNALLTEGNFSESDIAQIIVYLRDLCDYDRVKRIISARYQQTPVVYTLAPVCRPEWLIEMECIAIKQCTNETFREF